MSIAWTCFNLFGDISNVELRCLLHFHNAMSGQDKTLEKSLDVAPKFSLEEEKELLNTSFTQKNWKQQGSTVKPPHSSVTAPTFPVPPIPWIMDWGFNYGLSVNYGAAGVFAEVAWGDEDVIRKHILFKDLRKWRESEAVGSTWEDKVASSDPVVHQKPNKKLISCFILLILSFILPVSDRALPKSFSVWFLSHSFFFYS